MERIIIVGGGVAGLSCLNALLDKGISALLLEAANIGSPKMCGEFLAPPAVACLENWNIGPVQAIKQVTFFAKNKNLNIIFPEAAGAFARSEIELQLAERARQKGGQILENSAIKKIIPGTKNSPYHFSLATGIEIEAESAIFATGKLNQLSNQMKKLPYSGFKLHFQHVVKPETLLMYSIPNGYLGVVPVADKMSNCACLVRREVVEKVGSCKEYFFQLIENNKFIKNAFGTVDIKNLDWLEAQFPDFQLKTIPDWPRALWIGDALASVYPAIGYGFAHSIQSAIMAADFYVKNNEKNYHQSAIHQIAPKLRVGKWMHQLLLNPNFGFLTLPILQANPWMAHLFLKKIGYIENIK